MLEERRVGGGEVRSVSERIVLKMGRRVDELLMLQSRRSVSLLIP